MAPATGDASDDTAPSPADDAAWPAFFRLVFPELVRLVMLRTGNLAAAEDAASRAMEEVWQRWALLDKPEAYAYRVAIRHATGQQQRWAPENTALTDVDEQGQPDPHLAMVETAEWLRRRVAALPPGQRDVMQARLNGLGTDEIAALLGRSRDAVYQALHEARRRLTAEWNNDNAGDPRIPRPRPEGGPGDRSSATRASR